ncbi:MAG: putative bifunctional diguanylate cyclase/phosphodiesterase [Vulcanimicrobiaceae bacterium]
MEPPRTPLRHWRETLGLAIALIAMVLFLFAAYQIGLLNREAGGDIAVLARERVAIDYSRKLHALFVDVETYRSQLAMLRNPPGAPTIRKQIDREVRDLAAFTAGPAAVLDVQERWRAVESDWARARGERRVSAAPATSVIVRAIEDLYSALEDKSNLMYDPYRDSQNLADMIFAKIPGATNEAAHVDLIAENAVTTGSMKLGDRNEAAILLKFTEGDFDLSTDDVTDVLTDVNRQDPTLAALVQRAAGNATAYARAGAAFRNLVAHWVRDREHPAGNVATLRTLTTAALAATAAVNDDLLDIAQASLARRSQMEALHNRYLYASALFAAMFLVGLLLFVAESHVRREREALRRAQQESARLSAELAFEKASRALRLSEAQFRAVFDGAAIGIAILDRAGAILDANGVFRAVYANNSASVLAGHEGRFAGLMRGEFDFFEFEQHVLTDAGSEMWTDSTVSLVGDDAGKPLFAICMFRDLTELKRNERRLQHDMTHDSLTGLPNRLLLETKLRERFVAMKASRDAFFAVLFIDIDRFRDINESLGHEAGDFVLGQVAQRLRSSVEPDDIVARLASDEFAVLIRSLSDIVHVEVLARRMLAAMSKPLTLGERSIFVAPSIGVAVASASYERAEDVMRDADIAMQYAKNSGGSRFALFDSKMHARAEKRLQLTTDMRLGLERDEFYMLYQPIVNMIDGSLAGCEALLRWRHPVEHMMLPTEFMPLAEQTGLSAPIGRFVIRTACRQLAKWRAEEGLYSRPFTMNVNISAAELVDPEFETTLLESVREFGVDPGDLMLEITESVVLDAGTRSHAVVEQVRAHGFKVCIDDFGTGYSSLRYLQQFKVDAFKIDRSFVAAADGDVASEPIVRTLMTLAESFDVRVVAEGIETQRQRDALRNAGCRFAQGFFYAQPLLPEEVTGMYPEVFDLRARSASA